MGSPALEAVRFGPFVPFVPFGPFVPFRVFRFVGVGRIRGAAQTHRMNPKLKKVLVYVVVVLVGVVFAQRIRALPVIGDKIPSL